ncbi:MAG: glycosyltransferase 87 family protein [Streptosporangiales bacterium]|nr:glycosyltransferase 87 family protein [Streptosporangiales bacterium]
MDTVFVPSTEEAPPGESAHAGWPGRRTIAKWFGCFTVYAGLIAAFSGHADRTWSVWAFGGYALATLLLRYGRTWIVPLVTSVGISLLAPMIWLVTQQPPTAEVIVIGRGARHLLAYGTPYLPPSQLIDWKSYNPYMPVMELFGLPRAAGLNGALGDPRIWTTLVTAALLAATFAIASPHRLRDCPGCRRRTATLAAIALASPVFAYPLALGITDPPIIGLLFLTLALAYRGRWVPAGIALAVACAMKSTAWAALPVLADLAWVRYTPRVAVRITVTAVAATGLLSLAAAPTLVASTDSFLQNTVYFPFGLTVHKTPAESPLPGHILSTLGPGGHLAAMTLMAVAAAAFTGWVLLRPPRTAIAAGMVLAAGYAIVFILDPSSRFGYFVYPVGLLGWVTLTAGTPALRSLFLSHQQQEQRT